MGISRHAARSTQHAARSALGLALVLAAVLFGAAPGRGAARGPATPPPPALDRPAYLQLLHRALTDVLAAEAAKGAARDTAVARALADLPASLVVQDAGGPLAAVDLSRARDALQAAPPDPGAAQTQLTALIALLDPGSLPAPTATPSPTLEPGTPAATSTPEAPAYLPAGAAARGTPVAAGEAGRRLDQVLADPRFRPQEDNGIQRGLAAALAPFVGFMLGLPATQRNLLIAAVAGLLAAFMIYSGYREAPWSRRRYWATVAAGGLGTTAVVFLLLSYGGAGLALAGGAFVPVGGVLGVLVALGVLIFVGAGLRRARAPGAAGLAGAFAAEAGWNAAQARAAAVAAASAADYRKAIRYRYLATLLALDESGRLRFDPALTNLEYLRRAPAGLREPLRPLVQIFDRLWYGGYPATAEDYRDYQALAGRAEQAAPEARA